MVLNYASKKQINIAFTKHILLIIFLKPALFHSSRRSYFLLQYLSNIIRGKRFNKAFFGSDECAGNA